MTAGKEELIASHLAQSIRRAQQIRQEAIEKERQQEIEKEEAELEKRRQEDIEFEEKAKQQKVKLPTTFKMSDNTSAISFSTEI